MFHQSDFEAYAKHLGFDGIDADLFYEAYYDLDADDEYELIMEEYRTKWQSF